MTFDLTQHLINQSGTMYCVYDDDRFIKAFDTRKEAESLYGMLVADYDGTCTDTDHETGGCVMDYRPHEYRIVEELEE